MVSFPPILGKKPHTLILGSMPGQVSLSERQYYANPRNAFWWIMSHLADFSLELDYSQRTDHLRQAGFAVWDVLHDCERPGSLDSHIVRSSEQPNNIVGLLAANPTINLIGFNGRVAQAIFMRHCVKLIQTSSIELVLLPSTSPAHASITREAKLAVWRSTLLK